MVDQSEEPDLKIVDFGLSKIIGPNETSLDPFGTLVRVLANPNSPTWPQRCSFKSPMARKWTYGVWA